MHISNTYQAALRSPLQANRPNKSDAAFGAESKPDTARIDAIKSRYDVTRITPREADQAADELFAAGVSLKELLPFHHAGARFRQHLAQISAPFSAQKGFRLPSAAMQSEQTVNLIEVAQDQLTLAKHAGDDTSRHHANLRFLQSFPARTTPQPSLTVSAAVQAALHQIPR